MSTFTTAFIGAGNMAGGIIGGLLRKGFSADTIRASAATEEGLTRLQSLGLEALSTDNREVARGADVVVLAVKPQRLRGVCEELGPVIHRDQLLISVAAGVRAQSIHGWLGSTPALVRCMPNVPALLGFGAAGMFAYGEVSAAQRARAQAIMDAVGVSCWVDDEELIHAVTAVSGSGPAYFFQFMEAMIAQAQRMGLDADTARTLCAQTCIGAGQMLAQSEHSAAELRRRVCSPGGTTERAVAAFTAAGLEAIVGQAMQDCLERSREMADELA